MLFTPWLSNKTESYAQAHVIDVFNGYVYGEVTIEERSGKGAVTIYAPNVADVADEQWPRLLDGLKVRLGEKPKPNPAAASVATSGSPSLAAP